MNLTSNPNQQQQFLIPIQSTDGSHQQQNQLLFQPLQQKVVSFTPSLNSFAPPLNSLLQVIFIHIFFLFSNLFEVCDM